MTRGLFVNAPPARWETTLPASAYAAPATYLGNDGKQYVVIAAGGGGKWGTPSADAFVAFTLDETAPGGSP